MRPSGVFAKLKALLTGGLLHFRRERPCQHPEDERWTFTAMGVEEWICKVCGYHYERRNAAGRQ